jgi:hypothetical protein
VALPVLLFCSKLCLRPFIVEAATLKQALINAFRLMQ